MTPSRDIARLIETMAALRHPETGCAWDLKQTPASIVPYTIEEAYEVADAVERGDAEDLCEELGDLLLQVVFQARIAEEARLFDFGGVVEAITTKLVRRHPHIFGDTRDLTPDEVKAAWDRIKAEEKAERVARTGTGPDGTGQGGGLLGSVGAGIPPLPRAVALQRKAATVGFDWNDPRAVLAKIREEVDEVEGSLADPTALEDEIGDLLFAVANLARHAHIDPETALRAANRKFERRFGFIEATLAARNQAFAETDLDALEAIWREAKTGERAATTGPKLRPDPARQASAGGE